MLRPNKISKTLILLACLTAISTVSRGSYFLSSEHNLDSDQSIPLLMTKRILEFREFPFFYWGQNYMGLLEVWLAIPLMAIFSVTIKTFIVAEIFFSIILSFFLYLQFKNANEEKLRIIIAFFFAIGHPEFNSHLINVSENYISSLFLGFLGFYFIRNLAEKEMPKKTYFEIGALFGLALYNREILIVILPWLFLMTYEHWKKYYQNSIYILPGFLIGYLPAILHYLTTPYYKKLVRPTLTFPRDLSPGFKFVKAELFNSILISGDIYFSFPLLALGVFGAWQIFIERNHLIKKYFFYYSLGAISTLILFAISSSYMLIRYYFYLQCFILFFSAYGLFILFKKKRFMGTVFATIIGITFSLQSYQIWKKNLTLSKNTPEPKKVSEILASNQLKYGFCEFWAAYVTSYFSNDEVHCLIYLDKQSDFFSAQQVIQNRANFFLFRKDSNFDRHFLNTISHKKKFKKLETENFIIYVPPDATLDFLEPNREALLKELDFFQKR